MTAVQQDQKLARDLRNAALGTLYAGVAPLIVEPAAANNGAAAPAVGAS